MIYNFRRVAYSNPELRVIMKDRTFMHVNKIPWTAYQLMA
jgi:hypothetical protein